MRFLRDDDVAGSVARPDIIIDATGGFVQTTSDLLRRIEVYQGTINGVPPNNTRTYNRLAKRYDLVFLPNAPFAKSLLKEVVQYDVGDANRAPSPYATTSFEYYNEVGPGGFTDEATWSTQDDSLDFELLRAEKVGLSVLGASRTIGGGGGAYLGFNPTNPTKNGPFGGSFQISGSGTDSLAEFMDINGDLLPDKVFKQNGEVVFRLNASKPTDALNKAVTFEPKLRKVLESEVKALSREYEIGISGGPEAYFGLSIQFNIAGSVTVGEEYFTDVNSDGLPDFISSGTVYFNHLVPSPDNDGTLVPSFSKDSNGTAVPIVESPVGTVNIQALKDAEDSTRASSPLQDTVRRWIAPFSGVVSVDAKATFQAPSSYAGDGVRLAIQHSQQELWSANLVTPGASVTPSNVGAISVARGDALYFRVGPIDDGKADEVSWNPSITYTSYESGSATPATDVNDLSQKTYVAATDFTLAGRPGTFVLMPLEGHVKFEATLKKTDETSDNIRAQVLKNGAIILDQAIASTATGDTPLNVEFDTVAPTATVQDRVEVRLLADSAIDLGAISWAPRMYYTTAFVTQNSVKTPLSTTDKFGQPAYEVDVPWHIDMYPNSTLSAPSAPWTASDDEKQTVTVKFTVEEGDDFDGCRTFLSDDAILTIKQRGKLIAKKVVTVEHDSKDTDGNSCPAGQKADFTDKEYEGSVDVDFANGGEYWFDLSIRDTRLSSLISSSSVSLKDDQDAVTDVPSARYWQGSQGIFPIGYRGWGYAGYNGDGARATSPLIPADFDINVDALPKTDSAAQAQTPDDFDGPNPAKDSRAFAYVPQRLKVLDADGKVVDRISLWRGLKDNLAGGADFMRSSRTGADSVSLTPVNGVGASAVRRIGVTAPVFSLGGGAGPLGGSFGTGPSFGLLDYMDMNGDGFPDVVAPGFVQYTDPRGSRPDTSGEKTFRGDGIPVLAQDVTFGFNAGFSGSPLEIKGNSQGQVAAAQNAATNSGKGQSQGKTASSASGGEQASGDQYGVSLGLSLGVSGTFVNPPTTDPKFDSSKDKIKKATAPLEIEYSDVNGDGLPDRIEGTPQGVFVNLGLGYGFDSTQIPWAGGAFENNESWSTNVGPTLGFTTPNKEFSGGIAWNDSFDTSRYLWVDIDGDGVLDQLRKEGSGEIKVGFGSGAGFSGEQSYGKFADGTFTFFGDIPTGEQIAQGSSAGVGGGFSFTIGIGPLCLPAPACYFIINPNAHFETSISNTQIQLTDVNGDGYPDSVKSMDDGSMQVRMNKRGRTNMLKTVTNPIGGSIRLGYQRDGNTVDQPNSQWTMSSVEVDDGRPGDGADVTMTTYEYAGNKYSPLLREVLGYNKVTDVSDRS